MGTQAYYLLFSTIDAPSYSATNSALVLVNRTRPPQHWAPGQSARRDGGRSVGSDAVRRQLSFTSWCTRGRRGLT